MSLHVYSELVVPAQNFPRNVQDSSGDTPLMKSHYMDASDLSNFTGQFPA